MSQRFESLSAELRRLLLGAFYAAGALYFWLPSHEVFEGPKVQASLIYALLLALFSLPLFVQRLPPLWQARPPLLRSGAALLGATLLSLLGAYASLPGNLRLSVEHTAPVAAAAAAALVFWLESPGQRQRVVFLWMCAHSLLLFYGLVQVLDQNWGQSHGLAIDLIHWSQFGQSRVYSSMGNPDYLAAHLTLVLPLWAGLGWRRMDPRGPAQVAAAALLLIPVVLLPLVYGTGPMLGGFFQALGPWAAISAGLFVAARRSSAKACWFFMLGLIVLLIVLAQGRGAYLALAVSSVTLVAAAWLSGGRAWFSERWQTLKVVWGGMAAVAMILVALLVGRSIAPQAALFQAGAASSSLKAVDSLWDRITHISNSNNDAQVVRKFYWKAAWHIGLEHPLLGVGFGNHALFTARAQGGVWKQMLADQNPAVVLVEPHVELYTHNDFLQNWAETGLIGLAAFVFFCWIFLRSAWLQARQGPPGHRDLALGFLGLGVAFLVNAQFNFPWRVLATQQLCWLAWAMLALGPGLFESPAGEPAATPPPTAPALSPGAYAAGFAVVLLLALFPASWFFASAFFKQGNVLKDAQQVQAIPFYEKAVRTGLSGTQEVELYLYLGSMYNVAQRPDLAEQAFKHGLAAYPDFLEALYNLGYTYQTRFAQSHSLDDLNTAKQYYETLLAVDPRYLNALNNIGNVYYALKDFPKAIDAYQQLSRFGPNLVEGHYNLGATYLMLGDRDKALEAFDEALKVKPDYPPALQYDRALRALPKGAKLTLAPR
jgi:tetratricopeptide (TPR) repeat protein